LESCPLPPGFDLVVLSYALGEFSPARAQAIATRALKAATQALIIIEPGTPRSFQMMAGIRQALLDAGLTLVAPCPHHQECPLRRGNDWCHFAERVERTALHRRAKGGELGYEDEKFCYLAAMTPGALRSAQATQEMARPEARIVRHPRFHPGHVQLSLCTATGLQVKAVGKSQKQSYRAARKAHWGDGWPGANREP
jgi:ribosomal protein RSM22 (predicted rRNA methylase)